MSNTSGVNAEVTLGPALLGTTVASCLFGCSLIQTYGYYKRFPSDFPILKSLVSDDQSVLFIVNELYRLQRSCETLDVPWFRCSLCLGYWLLHIWFALFTGHGPWSSLPLKIPMGSQFSPLPGLWISSSLLSYATWYRYAILRLSVDFGKRPCPHQLFFAFRLFKFSRSWLLAIICATLGGISFGGTLADAARALNRGSMKGNMNAQYWLTVLSLVSGAMCDLIITAGLVFYLRKRRAAIKISRYAKICLNIADITVRVLHRTIDLLDKLTLWSIGETSFHRWDVMAHRCIRNWPCHQVIGGTTLKLFNEWFSLAV